MDEIIDKNVPRQGMSAETVHTRKVKTMQSARLAGLISPGFRWFLSAAKAEAAVGSATIANLTSPPTRSTNVEQT